MAGWGAGINQGIGQGMSWFSAIMGQQQERERMELLKQTQKKQALLQGVQTVSQIMKAPKNMRAPLLKAASADWQAAFGQPLDPTLLEVLGKADDEQAAVLGPMLADLGVKEKDPQKLLDVFGDWKTVFDYALKYGEAVQQRKGDEAFEKLAGGGRTSQRGPEGGVAMLMPELADQPATAFEAPPQPQAPPNPLAGLQRQYDELSLLQSQVRRAPQQQAIATRMATIQKEMDRLRGLEGGFTATVGTEGGGGMVRRFTAEGQPLADLGPQPQARAALTREDIMAALREEGWKPDMPGYGKAYLNVARQMPIQAGGGLVGAGQLVVPPPPGARTQTPGAPVPAAPGPSAGRSGPIAPMVEMAPTPATATQYMHKGTWQAPPPGMTKTEIEQSGQYVQVPTARQQSLSQGRVVKEMLDEIEDIIDRRPDLFPVKTGNPTRDATNVAKAVALSKIPGAEKYDEDLGRLKTLLVTMPAAVKAFGDTANVAVAEREITSTAIGLSPAAQDVALSRVGLLRRLVNQSIATSGLPPFESKPRPKKTTDDDVEAAKKRLFGR